MSTKQQTARSHASTADVTDLQGSQSTAETNYFGEGSHPGLPSSNAKKLARGLGWFSLGLGVTELFAPRFIAKISGISNKNTGLIRLYGLREIGSGIAIFLQEHPKEAVWSRVAGDAIDLASLGKSFTSPAAKPGRLAFATANVMAVTALDLICASQLTNGQSGIHAKATCIVNREPEEVYTFWRDFRNLPQFMSHLESVEELGEDRSEWTAKGPAGSTVTWRATIIADRPGESITWRSLENSDVDNAGAVRFERAPGGRGTIVKVNIQYAPPAGILGATVARFFGEEPNQQLDDDLRRFKQVMEIGEIVVSDATVLGTGYMSQRPGRPASADELNEADDRLPSQTLQNYESTEGRTNQ